MIKSLMGATCASFLLASCASNNLPATTAKDASVGVAECNRRMVEDKVDLETVAGIVRRDNCLEAIKLRSQLEKFSPDVVAATLGFSTCKSEARARNLTLAQHQDALFDCAFKSGGASARACLVEMVMSKVPVDALEISMGYCLQLKSGARR